MKPANYELFYYAYIGFAIGVAVFYLYLTLGGYVAPNYSVGGQTWNLAEVVAALFTAATIGVIYLRYRQEGEREASTAVSAKTAKRRERKR